MALTRWAMGVAEHGGHGGCDSSSHCPGVELDGQYVRPGWVLQFRTGQGGSVPDVHTPWLLQVIVCSPAPSEAKTAVRVLPLKTAESLLPVTVPRAVRQEPAGSVMVMSQPTCWMCIVAEAGGWNLSHPAQSCTGFGTGRHWNAAEDTFGGCPWRG